jgi:hypothetical protein
LQRGENLDSGRNHFLANAVAGNGGDLVCAHKMCLA